MRIDAHQHFWNIARSDYGWLTPELAPIYRTYRPHDLAPMIAAGGIDGTVLVQAAPSLAETQYMLGLADATPFIKGVVGWVDFESPEAAAVIADLAAHPKVVGLRPMIQGIEDTDWMLRDDLTPAYDAIVALDLTFDALTLPRHLKNLAALLGRHPQMRTVIDHASKPLIRDGIMDGWDSDMATLAKETDAFCKLSGLVTEAKPEWTVDDLKPYVDHLLETFGPARLIWGSDWPVSNLATTYDQWLETTETLLSGLSADETAAIMGGNAVRAYRLET